jgi:hypothetical protein
MCVADLHLHPPFLSSPLIGGAVTESEEKEWIE